MEGVYWKAKDVRDTRTFNYTYPELELWSTLSSDAKIRRLSDHITGLYGRNAPFLDLGSGLLPAAQTIARKTASIARVASTFSAIQEDVPAAQIQAQQVFSPVSEPVQIHTQTEDVAPRITHYFEWLVTIDIEVRELLYHWY